MFGITEPAKQLGRLKTFSFHAAGRDLALCNVNAQAHLLSGAPATPMIPLYEVVLVAVQQAHKMARRDRCIPARECYPIVRVFHQRCC